MPDVVIEETDVDDWQAILDLIQSQGWAYEYTDDGVPLDIPSAEEIFTRRERVGLVLKVWPVPEVQANFWPLEDETIDLDVDLRELQGQDRLDVLCDVLRILGRRVRKPVVMTAEGDRGNRILGYDVAADRVVLLTVPPA